jgi:hypothetical protein
MLPDRLALRLLVIAGCTVVGAAWLIHKGPMPVIRVTTPMPEMAPFWYMLLAFPLLGMLVADLLDLLARGIGRPAVELAVQIALLVAISSLRLGIRLPISGHALLVSYVIARRLLVLDAPPRRRATELAVAIALLAAIAYPKLFWWDDPITLVAGIAVGALLAGISRWLSRSANILAEARPASQGDEP